MGFFPKLVPKKFIQGVLDVLVARTRIIGGSGVIDKVMQSRSFQRSDIKNRLIISLEMLDRRQIRVIVVRKAEG
jgi:hypothetical protein